MDRLEKALIKAREQRRNVLEQVGVDTGRDIVSGATDEDMAAGVSRLVDAANASLTPVEQTRQVDLAEQLLEQNRIIARLRRDPNADIFRILRTKVMQLMTRNKLRSIAVTSPRYGDGKSTIAINLALSLALDVKQTVCLVDLDFRQPSVHRYMGIEPDMGLSDYLLHDMPVSQCLVRPALERLVVLPMKGRLENSSEILGTPKMAALAHELKTRYPDRIVIYDMPPLLAQDDAIAFLPNVDGVLLVVKEGATQVDDLRQSLHLLANTIVVGTVLNNAAERGYNRD